MRLLLTTDAVGGVWDYSVTLSRELERRGHTVLLAVLGDPEPQQIDQLPEGIAIECRNLRLEWMPDSGDDVEVAGRWVERLARSWGAQLVHLNQLAYSGVTAFTAPTVVVVHSDVCSWFGEVHGAEAPAEWDLYRRWVRAGLGAASAVVTPSHYQAALVERHFGRAVDRVIFNAVDPLPLPESLRKEPLLVSAGRAWDPAKGAEILDRALTLLGDEAPPSAHLGAVNGPAGERFDPSSLTTHGRVSSEEMGRWMSRATIYCAPSLYEPFGLAPLEAAWARCALVLSDIGSFRELWDGCAEFFPKGDAEGLARAIERVTADPAHARDLSRKAFERASSALTTERFTDAYLKLYMELGGTAPAGRTLSAPAPMPHDVIR